jgi:hypothetical protein
MCIEHIVATTGATGERHREKLWDTFVEETRYSVRQGNIVATITVKDWEKRWASLPSINTTNFQSWWDVVREFVREVLFDFHEVYKAALQELGAHQKDAEGKPASDSRLTQLAFDRVRKALRSLVPKDPPSN